MRKLILVLAALYAWGADPVAAPRQLTGSLVLGWLDTTAREFFDEHRNNPFTTLRLDYRDYLFAPDLFTYRVQPRISSGFQDAFTGLSEGSGIAFESILLPRRPWPFRFHFSKFRRSALTSGLGSSYSRFLSRNDDFTLGFQWQFAMPDLPTFELSFDKVATATSPEAVLTQGFENRSRTLSLSGRDVRKGWVLNGGASAQRLDTQYVLAFEQGATPVENRSNIGNAFLMAQRSLPRSLAVSLSANRTVNRNEFDLGLFNQKFESGSAKLEYRPERKFQAWSQARLTRTGLETRTSGRLDGLALAAPSINITNRMIDSEARYQVHPDLSLFGRNEFTNIAAPAAGPGQRGGNFTTSGGGASYLRTRKSVSFGGSYFLYSTLTRFAQMQQGSQLGHAVDGSIGAGDPSRIRVSGGLSFNRSHEDVRQLLPYISQSGRARLEVEKKFFHRWTLQAQGALSRSRYERQELRSRFLTKEYGLGLTGPNYHFSYLRSTGSGDSFQLLGLSAVAPVVVPQPLAFVLGSSNTSTAVSASWHVNSHFALRGIWRGQAQTIGPLLASKFEEQEATAEYRFRKVRLEAGYVVYRFNFGSPILRKSIVFRLTRDFSVF